MRAEYPRSRCWSSRNSSSSGESATRTANCGSPVHRTGPPLNNPEETFGPHHVLFATSAAELLPEVHVMGFQAECRGVPLDLFERSQFAWSHYLMFIEQEDRDSCSCDEFVDLRPFRPEFGACTDRRMFHGCGVPRRG